MGQLACYGVALAMLSACRDPGRDALDRLAEGTEALIDLADRHARGELDGPALNAALVAWERTERNTIEVLSVEAARALGPDLRAALAERWRGIAERLGKRLTAPSTKSPAPE